MDEVRKYLHKASQALDSLDVNEQYVRFVETVDNWISGFEIPDLATRLALKGFMFEQFTPDDLTAYYGSYVGKRSIHVNVYTLGGLRDILYEECVDGNSWWINGKRRSIDIKDLLTIKTSEEFMSNFQIYICDRPDESDDDLCKNLKQYLLIDGFRRFRQDKISILNEKKHDFSAWNY